MNCPRDRKALCGAILTVLVSASAWGQALAPPSALPLLSDEGVALLQRQQAVDFQPLRRNWVPQKPAHCGAASAVVVHNALRSEDRLTQDSLFTPDTDHIIRQETVYRIGFTLQELAAMVRARTALAVQAHHASDEDPASDYPAFLAALEQNRLSPRDHLILNFSRQYLRGAGTGNGHFSPVADYNPERDMVLILEVNAEREPYWIASRTIYEAMRTTDPVSKQHRGWLAVSAPPVDPPPAEH